LSNKYNVISFRLNKNVDPVTVLGKLEELFDKYGLRYLNCLFSLKADIIEYEHEGKLHSNRDKNAILTILKLHPDLAEFHHSLREKKETDQLAEAEIITNFCGEDYRLIGDADYYLIRGIIKQIPKPYGVNELILAFSGISFGEADSIGEKIKPSESGFGSPRGSYILYEREKHGDEKHSYVYFSSDANSIDKMRSLYLEFAEAVAGEYFGTEVVD
jgi:hypothetical protein